MSDDTPTKTCTKCGKSYPATRQFFYANKNSKSGMRTDCKQCSAKRAKAWRDANPEQHSKNNKRWAEANPDQMSKKNKRWEKENPNRRRQINRKYYHNNSEKCKSMTAKWRRKNPDKAAEEIRKANASRRAALNGVLRIPYKEQEVLDRYGETCYLCQIPINLSASRKTGVGDWQFGLHIDHMIPLSLGGPDTIDNVRPSHALCNIKKGRKNGT